LAEERDYLLDTLYSYFPAFRSRAVIDAFAGLRVLPLAGGTAFGRAREAELDLAVDGRLVTIYGGKLTAYRSTASDVMRKLAPVLPHRRPLADTENLTLGPAM
jgi:glycerol-3-phosphate dehydrogenase